MDERKDLEEEERKSQNWNRHEEKKSRNQKKKYKRQQENEEKRNRRKQTTKKLRKIMNRSTWGREGGREERGEEGRKGKHRSRS